MTGLTADVSLSAATDLVGWTPVMHSQGSDDVTTTFVSGVSHTVTGAGYTSGGAIGSHGGSTSTATVTLTDGGGRHIIVSRGYTHLPQAWPGWWPAVVGTSVSESVGMDVAFPSLAARAVLPPYRVWDPAGAPIEHPHQIFQRGDHLGAGGGLVFGPHTRQSSGLVFGTH